MTITLTSLDSATGQPEFRFTLNTQALRPAAGLVCSVLLPSAPGIGSGKECGFYWRANGWYLRVPADEALWVDGEHMAPGTVVRIADGSQIGVPPCQWQVSIRDPADLMTHCDFARFVEGCSENLETELPHGLLPAQLNWMRSGDHFWSTGSTSPETLTGPIERAEKNISIGWGQIGFWGYGANSHAFYLGYRTEREYVNLRLHWGGAYADEARQRREVRQLLPRVGRLVEKARNGDWRLEILKSMGSGRVVAEIADAVRIEHDVSVLDDPVRFRQLLATIDRAVCSRR